MTDKQIIIDGIDISGCEYCLKMTKYRCTIQRDVYKCLCEENPNCHYKQLKRKEQECEELKKQVEVIKERLFRKIAPIDYTDCPYYIKMVKFKQTLIEIKEIAEKQVKRAPDGETFARPEIKQILQKINKYEVGNE